VQGRKKRIRDTPNLPLIDRAIAMNEKITQVCDFSQIGNAAGDVGGS
jgi:hypothetical protein